MKQARTLLTRVTSGTYMHAAVLPDLARRHFGVVFDRLQQAANKAKQTKLLAFDSQETVQERWRKKGWRVHDYMLHPFFKGQKSKVMKHVDDKKGDRLIVINPLGVVREYTDMEMAGWYSPAAQEQQRAEANRKMKVGERRVPAPLGDAQKKALLKAFQEPVARCVRKI